MFITTSTLSMSLYQLDRLIAFIQSARELGNYKDSSAYVGAHLAQAFAGVSAVMNVVYPSVVDQNISEGALSI